MPSQDTIRQAQIRGLADKILDPDTNPIDRTVCLAQLQQMDHEVYYKVNELLSKAGR